MMEKEIFIPLAISLVVAAVLAFVIVVFPSLDIVDRVNFSVAIALVGILLYFLWRLSK